MKNKLGLLYVQLFVFPKTLFALRLTLRFGAMVKVA